MNFPQRGPRDKSAPHCHLRPLVVGHLFDDSGRALLCDINTSHSCSLTPACLCRRVFDLVHVLSHPLGQVTVKLIREKSIWHGINKDICLWAKKCKTHQTNKITSHTKSGIDTFSQPRCHFCHLHVDSCPAASIIWPEASLMADASTFSCTESHSSTAGSASSAS